MRQTNTHLPKTCLGLVAAAGALLLLPSCATTSGYQMADANSDGRVTPPEFDRYMLEAIYTEADANADKKITFEEWQAANPSADPEKFYAPDRNGDKVVSPGEAKAHLERKGTLTDLFDKMDTNNDNSVSETEAAAFKAKLQAESGSTNLEKLSNFSQPK
tara:strand:+ start:2400 stop:2879 length:480 start_codon:yes stop_codon:yes gene_type:complete